MMRNATRQNPTHNQKITNHKGIGLGYRPVRKTKILFQQLRITSMVEATKRKNLADHDEILITLDDKEINIPCPNLMQMRSSIMQIARESQQNAPTFFTGFLKNE